jgi:hypothetical protein
LKRQLACDHEDATSNNGRDSKGGQLEQPQHAFHLLILLLDFQPILPSVEQVSSKQAQLAMHNVAITVHQMMLFT